MNIGDIVIITESFGGGLPYVGGIGIFDREVDCTLRGVTYTSQAHVGTENSIIICNCTPATDLLKALF